jgi:hypothetical protein
MAADQGLAGAQFDYGRCLTLGRGGTLDADEGSRYLRLAADQGDPHIECEVGCMLSAVGESPAHLAEAVRYLRKAVAGGWPEAEGALLGCLDSYESESGEPFPQDDADEPQEQRWPQLVSDWVKDFESMIEIKQLGEGGFGVVTLVEDPVSHELIALKSFNKTTTMTSVNEDITQTFIREVEILIELHHPCILEIVGYLLPTRSHPGRIGTRYASNGSLREALDERRRGNRVSLLDDTGIALIITGIVIGMKFIHSRGIIHRDLKPANILIEDNGFIRIGDLGSSRIADSEVTKTTQIGTPIYMAPEMYDYSDYSCSVDVFAFALIMYEVIVGDYVFSPTLSPMILMKKVSSSERPVFPSNIPEVLRWMMSRCWSADANSRDSFEDILRQLEEMKYAMLPGVDTGRVMDFVQWVNEHE